MTRTTQPKKLKKRAYQAKRHLLDFTRHTFPRYVADPAHGLVARRLDDVIAGELDRLMIFAPPQHGKSELVSVRLPAFWLGKRPDDPIIISSYAAALAHSKSRQSRNVVESQEYAAIFDARTDPTARARNEWTLAAPHRGAVVAAGVGGPIVGHGAALGVIDDPIESWAHAQSETIRENIWEWWQGTFRHRVWSDGAIVLIMTRWHEDDLAGRLLMDQPGRWEVLRLPAMAETQEVRDFRNEKMGLPTGQPDPLKREVGEALCPSRFSVEALESIRRDVGSQVWAGLYQGAPTAPEGNRFKRGWFPIVDEVPLGAERVRYWDLAATAGGGARTAGVLLAMHNRVIYVEDVVYGQWSTGERNDVMRQTADLDKRREYVQICFEEEGGSSGKDASRAIIQHMMGFPITAHRPTGNKDVRLEPFAAQAEAGNVRIIRGAWNGVYIDEMCAVPSGRYRDMADATAGAFNWLAPTGGVGLAPPDAARATLVQPSRWTAQTTPRWNRNKRR